MEDKLRDKAVSDFAGLTASTAPAPGGGAAAALTAGLAAALCAMAARLTAGRKKYADRRSALEDVITQVDKVRQELIILIDADAEGFAPLAAAYALPKDTPDYAKIMRDATLEACKAPRQMLLCCRDTAELLEQMLQLTSPLLLSDVGCGAALCRAGLEAAAMNLFVNTRTLKGDEEADRLSRETRELLNEYVPRLQALADEVTERLQ